MSKKYKDKSCVYCGKPSTTADHVFAKEFFLTHQRNNIPKVPSCQPCNVNKSRIEGEVLILLPFGARHSDALENLRQNLPGRLNSNKRLLKEIQSSFSTVWVQNSQIVLPHKAFDINPKIIEDLFDLITKSLVFHHFEINIAKSCTVATTIDLDYSSKFDGYSKKQVSNNLGNGTISYRGAQAYDNDYATLWEYTIFGGIDLGKGPQNFYSLTLPKKENDLL